MGCFDPDESKSVSTGKTAKQNIWLDKLLDIYGPTAGTGQESFPGQRVAPFSPAQQQALDVGDFMKYFSPDYQMPLFGETGTALSGVLSSKTGAQPYTPEAAEKYYISTIENPAYKRWSEKTRPEIESAHAGPGYWSSARAGAVAKGATDLGDWLGTQHGGLMWDVEQANRAIEEAKANRALGAIGPAMQYGAMPTQEATARLMGRGGVFDFLTREQQQRQAEINAEIQKWAESKRITDPENLEILMNLLNMNYSYSRGDKTGAGWFGGSEGGQNFGQALAAIFASDERLKENIKPIKDALNKVMQLDGKKFNFKGKCPTEIGLIAQDLQRVLPEAVIKNESGYLLLNYFAVIPLLVNAIKELAERID